MPIIASETGKLAADSVAEIFVGAGNDIDAQLGAAKWAAGKLAEGGWTGLTSSESDADLTLRDIQQIARVTGRFVVPNALTTTLLAGRWFGIDESQLAGGATFPVACGHGAGLPYAVPEVRVVDAAGQVTDAPDADRDEFSLVLPIVPAAASSAVIDSGRMPDLFAVLAATATGCADAVLARSIDWVQTRQQFGQPLKAFQALRHHLADMHIAREEAWTCAVAAGEEPERAVEWAWIAMQRAKTVIQTGIQVHGGIGFTWEAGIHHWLRHVMALETLINDNRAGADS